MSVLPLLCAKFFATITALGTALTTISALPAGPQTTLADARLAVEMPPPSALITARTLSIPAEGASFGGTPQFGALVWQNPDGTPGGKLCSAVAVDSAAGDVIATAAHCVVGIALGIGGPMSVAYVPECGPGRAPYGVWYPTRLTVARQWRTQQDPDYDLAFLNVARPTSSVPLEQVTGAERVGGAALSGQFGVLMGYPFDASRPVACRGVIGRESETQLKFDCADFPVGTSGGPLLTDVDPRTGAGTLAGVIGGYELGGRRANVSYAAALTPALVALYQKAATHPPMPLLLNGLL